MTVQELNKTPLSQAALKAAQEAYQMKATSDSLYLIQALQETLEHNQPPKQDLYLTERKVWWAMQDFLETADYHRDQRAVYKTMTENSEYGEPVVTDSKLLQWMDEEKDPEDKLRVLLANTEWIVEANGLNLSGIYPDSE